MSPGDLVLDSMRHLEGQDVASCIASFVEALAQVDALFLLRNPGAPRLYRSGVRYQEDAPWQDVPALLRTKRGDCKSLVAWRLAELRSEGTSALVHVVHMAREGEDLFHVQVRRGKSIEDPSRLLGMGT